METVKGFRDYTGKEALKRAKIKKILIETFEKYGFFPAETPIIEYESFVKGNNQNDEVISDIFKLKDKGNRKLALRYEPTFQLKRISKDKRLPFRRYQIAEVFRDEPVSSNRFRQFTQCDVDIIGSNIRNEAEVLKAFSEIFDKLGIEIKIYINNRKLLNEILDKEKIKNKEQIIREIDKLDKLSESEVKKNLKKYKADQLLKIFKNKKDFFKKYKEYEDIESLMNYCKIFGIEVNFLPSLARGLSYYNGSIFEIKTKGMKETIAAGGSYLTNNIQSTGISMGLERVSKIAKLSLEGIRAIIISINQEKEAIMLAENLRKNGVSCFILDKISKALDYANKEFVPYVIFVGKEEVSKKKFKLRDMKKGKEKLLSLKQLANSL